MKIETEVITATERFEPSLGEVYRIVAVQRIFTDSGLSGLEVSVKERSGKTGKYVVWLKDRTRSNSRLAAHVQLLGYETDAWVGAYIKFSQWGRTGTQMMRGERDAESTKASEASKAS